MNKALEHFILLAAWFFTMWFLLSKIHFTEIFKIEQFTRENEHKLSTLVLDAIRKDHDEIESDSVVQYIAGIKTLICDSSGVADSTITLHLIAQDEVNAFALPDRQLVINAGLIQYCASPEELAGVIAHEVAHIEHRHVMQKLVKEIGMMMLVSIARGESGSGIMREVVKTVSSTSFDREQESEADAAAVHYMARAGIDPEHLATFLLRLSREKNSVPGHFELLSTHPNSNDRAAEIMKLRKVETFTPRPIAKAAEWKSLQESLADVVAYAGEE